MSGNEFTPKQVVFRVRRVGVRRVGGSKVPAYLPAARCLSSSTLTVWPIRVSVSILVT